MDDPCDFPDIPISPHKKITKLHRDLIENWGFRVDVP